MKGFVCLSGLEGSHKLINDLFGVYKLVFTHSDNQDGVKKDHDYCEVNTFGKNGLIWTSNNLLQSNWTFMTRYCNDIQTSFAYISN